MFFLMFKRFMLIFMFLVWHQWHWNTPEPYQARFQSGSCFQTPCFIEHNSSAHSHWYLRGMWVHTHTHTHTHIFACILFLLLCMVDKIPVYKINLSVTARLYCWVSGVDSQRLVEKLQTKFREQPCSNAARLAPEWPHNPQYPPARE